METCYQMVFVTLLVLSIGLVQVGQAGYERPTRPNIVFVLTDDQDTAIGGVVGDGQVLITISQTPVVLTF